MIAVRTLDDCSSLHVDDADRCVTRSAGRAAKRPHELLDGEVTRQLCAVKRAAVLVGIAVHQNGEGLGGEVVEGVARGHRLNGSGARARVVSLRCPLILLPLLGMS